MHPLINALLNGWAILRSCSCKTAWLCGDEYSFRVSGGWASCFLEPWFALFRGFWQNSGVPVIAPDVVANNGEDAINCRIR